MLIKLIFAPRATKTFLYIVSKKISAFAEMTMKAVAA